MNQTFVAGFSEEQIPHALLRTYTARKKRIRDDRAMVLGGEIIRKHIFLARQRAQCT